MAALKKEDLLSDVEPLPVSPSSSPPPSFLAPSLTNTCLPQPPLTRSWPPSPLSTLTASSQVTTRLYASLKSSQDLGMCDAAAPTDRRRQVTFSLSSSSVPGENAASWPEASHPSFPERLEEREGARSSSPTSLSTCLSPDGADAGPEEEALELADMAEEMSMNLQASVEHSSASVPSGRQHIQDMESVRSHLQTLLRAGQKPIERERGVNYFSGFSLLEGQRKDTSFESDTTSHLISAPVLAEVPPPLSLSGLDELFPRYSRLQTNSGLATSTEIQVLRESLDRERVRRKHCEKQMEVLQDRALQLQQQLHLAVAADRKKDIMIEQLDKTLAKVVEGWRKHEEEESEGLRQLQEEKEDAQRSQAKQQEMMLHLEKSLSEAAETLDRERKHIEELSSTNQQLEKCLAELRTQLEEQGRQGERAQTELEEARRETREARTSLTQHKEAWAFRERELEDRLEMRGAELNKEKVSREREGQRLLEAQRELRAAQTRLQQLEGEVEEARRERDGERMDRALEQARFEAQRSQLEVELKLSVEHQVTERLAALQKENAEATASLREQHRKQLLELSARQEGELSAQLAQFRVELQERDERQRRLVQDYERRLCVKQEEVQSLEASRRKLEAQRAELVSRLQCLMRSHWAEALKLLATQSQMEDPPSQTSQYKTPLDEGSENHVVELDSTATSKEMPQSSSMFLSLPSTHRPSFPSVPLDTQKVAAPPRALVLLPSREPVQTREESDPNKACPNMSQLDASSLLNHSTFCALEPQLDDTGVTASGDCDLDNLCEMPVSRQENGLQRLMVPWTHHGVEKGHGGVESVFGSMQERAAKEGYSPSSSQGLGGYHGDRGRMDRVELSGEHRVSLRCSAASDWEDPKRSGKEPPSSLRLSRLNVEAQRKVQTADEMCSLGERSCSSRGLRQGHTGAYMSNTGSLEDSCNSTAAGSQSVLLRVPEGSVGTAPSGHTPSGHTPFDTMERSTVLHPTNTAYIVRPGAQNVLRQAQLQYYINMLLDRSPGEPLDTPTLNSSREPVSPSSQVQTAAAGASQENKTIQNPEAPAVVPFRPSSSAVTKTKLRPLNPVQTPQGRPEPSPALQDGSGRASLTTQQLTQLSRLVEECRSQPNLAMPSLEDLLARLLSNQADRSVGSSEWEGDTFLHRSLEQKLNQVDQKELAVMTSQQRRVQTQRMAEGSRTQSHAPKGRRGGSQVQKAVATRGSAWR